MQAAARGGFGVLRLLFPRPGAELQAYASGLQHLKFWKRKMGSQRRPVAAVVLESAPIPGADSRTTQHPPNGKENRRSCTPSLIDFHF